MSLLPPIKNSPLLPRVLSPQKIANGNEESVGDGWSMARNGSVEENKVMHDLLQYTDAELVCKWTCTLFQCSKRRMAKRTFHPPLKPYLSEGHS